MVPISAISLHQVNSLVPQVATFEASMAEALGQGDPERAAGLVLAARLEEKAHIDGQQLLWLLERFADPMLVPCLVGACADPIDTLARCIRLLPDKNVVISIFLVLGLLLEGQTIPKSVLRPARRFLKATPFSSAYPPGGFATGGGGGAPMYLRLKPVSLAGPPPQTVASPTPATFAAAGITELKPEQFELVDGSGNLADGDVSSALVGHQQALGQMNEVLASMEAGDPLTPAGQFDFDLNRFVKVADRLHIVWRD